VALCFSCKYQPVKAPTEKSKDFKAKQPLKSIFSVLSLKHTTLAQIKNFVKDLLND